MPSQQEILINLIREVNRDLSLTMKKSFSEFNLPFPALIIAKHLGKEPGISLSELSRRTNIAKSYVSNIIDELSRRNWVEKLADPNDQRLIRIYLTEDAKKNMSVLKEKLHLNFASIIAELPDNRVQQLIEGLQDLKSILAKNSAAN